MKKLLSVLLLVTMLSIGATPAFAANANAAKRGTLFTLAGEITAINGDVVSVLVRSGSSVVRPFLGQILDITTTANTRFLLKTPDGTVTITLEDLEVGDKVSVQGSVADDVWTATRITVGAKLIH